MEFVDLSTPLDVLEEKHEDVEREARNDTRRQARAMVYDLFKAFALAMEPMEEGDE